VSAPRDGAYCRWRGVTARRHLKHGIWLLVLLAGPALGQGEAIGWQEAVARLAHERTRAETCVRLLKKYGDDGAVSRGDLTYGEAKAEVDAVIAGLIVALTKEEEPATLPDLETRLVRGVAGREAFCEQVKPLLPAATGEKNFIAELVTGALEPLIAAVKEIYLDAEEADRLTRLTIQTQLEATKWPAFADIAYSN
jgi:hypothetical protein